jgi:hypothetical protein
LSGKADGARNVVAEDESQRAANSCAGRLRRLACRGLYVGVYVPPCLR